jgi:hypothetical protein
MRLCSTRAHIQANGRSLAGEESERDASVLAPIPAAGIAARPWAAPDRWKKLLEMSQLSERAKSMQFILTGFTQDRGFRVFAFEGIAADRVQTQFTVRADLVLSRQYGIRLQELPLMCRAVLEGREEGDQENAMTFCEEAMRLHETNCIAARALAALKKKTFRRPVAETV